MKSAVFIGIVISCIMMPSVRLPAQINARYAFTQSSTVWEPFMGDYVTEAMDDEGLSSPIDIGFTFPYGTTSFTQVKISSNGWLNLGTNLNLPYYANDLATLNIRPLVAPLWDDIGMQYGAVQYVSFGTAPHRIFYAQWQAARWNYMTNNEFNFMARLHETGQIDFIYGPHTGAPGSASASIGINMSPGGSGNYFSILPGQPAQAFTTTQHQNINTALPSGTMYIFMPKSFSAVNAAAVNLNGSKFPAQGTATSYTVTLGNAGTTPIYANSGNVMLMRGGEVLATGSLPNIAPGAFNTATLSWTPDTVGQFYLYGKVVLSGDADSLNNATFPYAVTVLPPIANEDELAPPAQAGISAYPNPFRDKVTLTLGKSSPEPVWLAIYDLKGRKVRGLVAGSSENDGFSVVWDGMDDNGKAVPNGMYYCREVKKGNSAVKLILLR